MCRRTRPSGRLRSGRRPALPLVGEELPVERDDDAVALGVGAAFDGQVEVDRAHDPVAELLVDELLDGGSVDLQRLGRVGVLPTGPPQTRLSYPNWIGMAMGRA